MDHRSEIIGRNLRENVPESVPVSLKSQFDVLQDELAALKAAKRDADLEVVELKAHLRDAETIRQSLNFQIGSIVVTFFTTWRGFLLLWPRVIRLLVREFRGDRDKNRGAGLRSNPDRHASEIAHAMEQVRAKLSSSGSHKTVAWIRRRRFRRATTAKLLVEVGRIIAKKEPAQAVALNVEALRLDGNGDSQRRLVWTLAEAGEIKAAANLIRDLLSEGILPKASEQKLFASLLVLDELPAFAVETGAAAQPRNPLPLAQSIVLLVDDAISQSWSIAAFRAHGLAVAMKSAGYNVTVATLGSQFTIRGQPQELSIIEIDSIPYIELGGVDLNIDRRPQFVRSVIARVERQIANLGFDTIVSLEGDCASVIATLLRQRLPVRLLIDVERCSRFRPPEGIYLHEAMRNDVNRILRMRLETYADNLASLTLASSEHWSRFTALYLTGLRAESPSSPGYFRQRLGLGPDTWLFGTVIDAHTERDLAILQELPAQLNSTPHSTIAFAGVGRRLEKLYANAVKRAPKDTVHIIRAPDRQSLRAYFSEISMYLAPLVDQNESTHQVPFDIVQALSCGAPVLVTSNQDTEAWLRAGIPVLLVDEPGVAGWVKHIVKLLAEPARLDVAREEAITFSQRLMSSNGAHELMRSWFGSTISEIQRTALAEESR